MLRIIGKASSINVRKVLWACEEIGIAYTREDSALEMALNPNGLVPVMVDGDFVLWEGNTILRYLANKWRATSLLPTEPRARAEVERWIDWQATEFNTAWRYAFSALVRRNPAFDDSRWIEASKADWTRMVGILAGGCSHRPKRQPLVHDTDGPAQLSRRLGLLRPVEPAAGLSHARA